MLMSYQMIEQIKFAPVTPTQKLVLLALADCHNVKTGRCNPSIRFLEAVTGLSTRSIIASIRELCNASIVTKTAFKGGKNSYFFTSIKYDYPCTSCTSEGDALVNVVQGSGERGAGGVVHVVQDITGIITGKEPEILTGSASPKPRRRKKASESDPRHLQFRKLWMEVFQAKTGSKYQFTKPDGVQLARFLRHESAMKVEEWQEFLLWMHSTIAAKGTFTPGIIKRAAGSLAIACSSFSKLLIESQSA